MIKHNGTGFINQTGYGVMKLGRYPVLRSVSAMADSEYERLDAEQKYGQKGGKKYTRKHESHSLFLRLNGIKGARV